MAQARHTTPTSFGRIVPPDDAWLARQAPEPILEPALPCIDTHHHLWDRPDHRYLLDELLADLNSGRNVVATVFLECHSMYRADGPEPMRPVGETEFVAGIGAMSDSGRYGAARVAAGIVGFADLLLGDRVEPVLEAHVRAGGGRFRGVRYSAAWDASPVIGNIGSVAGPHILRNADVRGPYAGKRDDVFAGWKASIIEPATCPNVTMKVSGMMMRLAAFDYGGADAPVSSAELAALWRPYIETCIERFGPARCMFESNFPVDKMGIGYAALWNAFKRITAGATADEKLALFSGTARRVYRLAVS